MVREGPRRSQRGGLLLPSVALANGVIRSSNGLAPEEPVVEAGVRGMLTG